MSEIKIERKSKVYATQKFYTKKLALQMQISDNGIFFEIAPILTGTDRFNWDLKVGTKFSVSEICNMLYALEQLREKGTEGYMDLAKSLFGEKYKNVQYIHINRKEQQVRTGLNLYNGNLNFIIVNQKENINLSFPLLPTEKIRFEKFLNYIVSVAFQRGI